MRTVNFLIRFFAGLDFALISLFYIVVYTGYEEASALGPGRILTFAFFLLAAALMILYSDDYFVHAKILAIFGLILTLISIGRAVEEVVDKAFHKSLNSAIIPPFYHASGEIHSGLETGISRIGTIFVVLAILMVVPIILYEDIEQARSVALFVSNVSIPSIVVLAGYISSHVEFISAQPRRAVDVMKFAILLPIFSLVLIDLYAALKSVPREEI